MKVVYDTCLYIDFLRSRDRIDLFTTREHLRYLSPVVVMELRSGARTKKQKRAVDRLLSPYSRANRIIHLDSNLFYKAGEYLARLGKDRLSAHRFLANDLLIALSSLSIGATLFTSDRKDFSVITPIVPIHVTYV